MKANHVAWASIAIGVLIVVVFVGAFQFRYPELTQTQVLFERWPYIIAALFFLTVGYGMEKYGWGKDDG